MKKVSAFVILISVSLHAMQSPQERNTASLNLPDTPSYNPSRAISPLPGFYEIPCSQLRQQSTPDTPQALYRYRKPLPLSPLTSPKRCRDRKRDINTLSIAESHSQELQKHPRPETPLSGNTYTTMQNSAANQLVDNQPLFDAIARRDIQFIRENKKRSLSSKNKQGDTPLHAAVRECHADIVKLLLEQGADRCELNSDGLTSVELAQQIVTATQEEIDSHQDYDMYNALNCTSILELLTPARACPSLGASSNNRPLHQGQKQKESGHRAAEETENMPESSGSTYDYLSDAVPQKDGEKMDIPQEK